MTLQPRGRGSGWRLWLGLALGLLMLALAVRSVGLSQVWAAMQSVRVPYVVLAWLMVVLTTLAKGVRWRSLMHPHRTTIGAWALSSLVVIGQAVNFFIPGRWGELVRAYLGGEETGIGKAFLLGTIAAEKLLDVVMLALLAATLLPLIVWSGRGLPAIRPALATAVVLAVVTILFLAGRRLWLRMASRLLERLPPATAMRWHGRVVALLDGLSVLSAAQAAPAIWGWTLVCWLLAALTNWFLLVAFALPPSLLAALFVLVVLQGGVSVPSTPGKIGVFQYLCVFALGVFDVPTAVGFSYGLVLYALVAGTMAVWAALALWQRSMSLQRLRAATADFTTAVARRR